MNTPERFDLQETSVPRSGVSRIFFGDDGFRAGWSLLLFLLLFAALIIGVHSVPIPLRLQSEPAAPGSAEITARETILSNGWQLAALFLITLLMSLIERRSFVRYGLARARMLSDLGAGLFWGAAMLSVLVGTLTLKRSLRFGGVVLRGSSALVYAGE